MAVEGDRIVVGAKNQDGVGHESGVVYIYEPDGAGGWAESTLAPSDATAVGLVRFCGGHRWATGSW